MNLLGWALTQWASQVTRVVKNLPANAGDLRDADLISGLGRSPGGHCNPLQYSCLENSTDRGAWQATVRRFANRTDGLTLLHFSPFANKTFSSVKLSCSVVSNYLRPHGLQHARLPSPSSTPRVYSNSCQLSRWCHPTVSSSVNPSSSRLQSFQWASSLHQVAKVLEFQF